MVSSWLGDGDNDGVNPGKLLEMFGGDKLSQFDENLGVDQDSATQGLSSMLPNLVDQGSSGGNMLDSIGGLGGALDLAKKFF